MELYSLIDLKDRKIEHTMEFLHLGNRKMVEDL